jgi:hypothetical protein
MTTAIDISRFEELDYRENDGIEVSLRWNRDDNSLAVVVVDIKADATFELFVEGAEAMDVFRHPFAYAASHGAKTDFSSGTTGLSATRPARTTRPAAASPSGPSAGSMASGRRSPGSFWASPAHNQIAAGLAAADVTGRPVP